jgi:hypothetical protein
MSMKRILKLGGNVRVIAVSLVRERLVDVETPDAHSSLRHPVWITKHELELIVDRLRRKGGKQCKYPQCPAEAPVD